MTGRREGREPRPYFLSFSLPTIPRAARSSPQSSRNQSQKPLWRREGVGQNSTAQFFSFIVCSLKGNPFMVDTRSHGLEGGSTQQHTCEIMDFWSITCCAIRGKKLSVQQRMRLSTVGQVVIREEPKAQDFAVRILNAFVCRFFFLVCSLVFLGLGLG